MLDTTATDTALTRPRLTDGIDPVRLARLKRQEYATMFWLIAPVCLVVALVRRLVPARDAFHSTHSAPRRGLFGEAAHMAHTVIPFAFWR
ncbi:MAG: hypothetical protein ACFBWO_07565 [Paracoccaceae bacterium]